MYLSLYNRGLYKIDLMFLQHIHTEEIVLLCNFEIVQQNVVEM